MLAVAWESDNGFAFMDRDMDAIESACEAIRRADGLLITAGAGLGVDSGLPDFRGKEGFWRAYPALAESGVHFQDIASPSAFQRNPRQAWGFYGHRMNLYRETLPHEGFQILLKIAGHLKKKFFVVTSNVDGQFQRAGFQPERIYEVHGSIGHLQCLEGCSTEIWPADDYIPEVDESRCELRFDFPTCPRCGGLARPNILMFGDWGWLDHRSKTQALRLHAWLLDTERKAIIELGAGLDIPTIRLMGERQEGAFIRVNPRDADVPEGGIAVKLGALEALRLIKRRFEAAEGR